MSRSVSSSSSSPSTSTSTTAPSSSSTGTSFQFTNIAEMFTCGIAVLEWTYSGPEAPMSFRITNVNVPQQAPLSIPSAATSKTENGNATSSAAKRGITMRKRQYGGYGGTYLPQIDEQLATQLDPLVGIWRWPSANVPQGWYQILANVQGIIETPSPSFFVQNGTNVNCVLQFYPASSTSTPTSTVIGPASNETTNATQAPATESSSSKAVSHTAAVAGGIIGGVGAVILVILIIIFARRRGRQNYMRRENVDPAFASEAPVVGAGVATPSSAPALLHHQSSPFGTPVVPLNSSQASLPSATLVPVGLTGKELARLRSRAAVPLTAEFAPASSSASDSQPATTTSPPIVVTPRQSEVTSPSETAVQSEVEYLRREVLRLHAQQVRAEVFQAPPSYGDEAR